MSPKSSAVGVVYSNACDSGFGGYFVQLAWRKFSFRLFGLKIKYIPTPLLGRF